MTPHVRMMVTARDLLLYLRLLYHTFPPFLL